ncbi:hypothetical protein HELRODRAFT_132449, partial [Helobdella robusta]|uniref:tRNA (guanine(10)-N(2))-methyltransferase TRMT11 n=1 Tax=Helobdella robusta TaxID=6412 RepID=T1EHY6_HELRO
RSAIEVWVQAVSYSSFYSQLASLSPEVLVEILFSFSSFRIKVESFNKQLSLQEKINKIEQLTSGPVNFGGQINLKDGCDVTYCLLEYYERVNNQSAETPSQIYFGKWICDSQRDVLKKYNLSSRKFIGNTSMDPTLSMIMANMAHVREGSLVYDPFVGTGSLLVSCAHFGGHVMGSDIDYNIITGVGKSSRAGQKYRCREESIRNNLKQYGLEARYIDAFIADASLHDKLWKFSKKGLFDAIITDPPYGIREPTTKLGFKKEPIDDMKPEIEENHIPCKKNYNLNEILCDLLCFAAKYLVEGGRLVYWMPIYRNDYSDLNIPQHERLRLVSNCEQVLNNRVSRRMITMQKI